MTRHARLIGLRTLAFSLLVLSGCGRWSPDRYEQATAQRIDSQLQIGMSLADFRSRYPTAVTLESDGDQQSFLLTDHEVCLLCRTGHGFLVSEDVFARRVSFESGRLMAIEAVPREAR